MGLAPYCPATHWAAPIIGEAVAFAAVVRAEDPKVTAARGEVRVGAPRPMSTFKTIPSCWVRPRNWQRSPKRRGTSQRRRRHCNVWRNAGEAMNSAGQPQGRGGEG